MATRRWSYRSSWPIATVLHPWRPHLEDADFEAVVRDLDERDHLLDSHLNFNKSQGLLVENQGSFGFNVGIANCPTETTVTEVTSEVTVPAHRRLLISGVNHILAQPLSLGEEVTIRVKRNGTTINTRVTYDIFNDPNIPEERDYYHPYFVFDEPPAGTHEYTLTYCHSSGLGFTEYPPGTPIMRIQDMGPTL